MTWLREYREDMADCSRRLERPDVPVADVETSAGRVRHARYGQGRPVLVLHGSGGGWDQGVDWARRRLAGEPGYDVVSPSRFGYPGSDLPAGATVSLQAAVLVELLDRLGLDAVDVAALSAGSATALRLAADHPGRVRRLVLESPLVPLAGRAPLPPVAVVRVLARAQPLLWATTRIPAVVRLASGAGPRELTAAARTELTEINRTTFPLRPRAAGMVFDRAVAVPEVLGDRVPLERVLAPTLVVNARHALLAPQADAERFVSRLPDGRLVELDRGGHVLVGNVEELRSTVGAFLSAPG